MTVIGPTTAVVAATPYTPPFKYVTSYAPAPSVTGTITQPISNNPTVAPGTSDADYAWAYLQSHMMSWPSYRWLYLMWVLFAVIALLYTLSHHIRFNASSSGAALSKWAIRRQPIGKRRAGGVRGRALPSNGVLLTSFIIVAVAVLLSFIGHDYIAPSSGVLNFGTSFSRRQLLAPGQIQYSSPSYNINKSLWTIASRLGDTAFALVPLTVLLALKSPPVAILAWRGLAHLYSDKLATFHKIAAWLVWAVTTGHVAVWTVQLFVDQRSGRGAWFAMWRNYRFIAGVAAYTTLTLLMVLSLRVVRQKRYEFFYIAHVTLVLLTIALSALHHPVLWFWMAAAFGIWALERIWRVIRVWRINGLSSRRSTSSYVAARQYEDLPQSDTYAMSDIKGQYDRSDSGYLDKTLPRPPGQTTGEWSPASTPRGSFDQPRDEFGQRAHSGYYDEGSLQPLGAYEDRHSSDMPRGGGNEIGRGARSVSGGFTDPYSSPGYLSAPTGQRRISASSDRPRVVSGRSELDVDVSAQRTSAYSQHSTVPSMVAVPIAPIPIGHALAQLLPSRTIRLTIRVARPFRWVPGQSVLLYLPELSKIQSHPFTINNIPDSDGEIVLLVKARKGLTRQLYEIIRSRCLASMNMSINGGESIPRQSMSTVGRDGDLKVAKGKRVEAAAPIYIRAKVDGPFGSAARVKWGDHATVVIICGGSGVSFGAAILEYLCKRLRDGAGKRDRRRRVRFCWIAREYAEIAWVAHQLRRTQAMVTAAQVQIEIYITNSVPLPHRSRGRATYTGIQSGYDQPTASTDELAPPRAAFAKSASSSRDSSPDRGQNGQAMGKRSASMDSLRSVASDMSTDSVVVPGYSESDDVDNHLGENYADVIDLTNYEDEEDVNDPGENALSSKLREQGKIRRARSRREAKGGRGGHPRSSAVGMGRRGSALAQETGGSQYGHGGPNGQQGGSRNPTSPLSPPRKAEGGMSTSTSAPGGFATLQHPVPRSSQSQYALSAYDQPQPLLPDDDPYGRRSYHGSSPGLRHPSSNPFEQNHLAPRPSTTYDTSSRPGSASLRPSGPSSHSHLSGSGPSYASSNTLAPPAHIADKRDGGRRASYQPYATHSDSMYGAYDPFAGTGGMKGHASPGSSIRHFGGEDDTGSIAGDSIRPFYSTRDSSTVMGLDLRSSRTGSMVLLDESTLRDESRRADEGRKGRRRLDSDYAGGKDLQRQGTNAGLWIDVADYESMAIMSELAISGKPALGRVLEEEIERAEGSLIVTTCGPTTLNTVVRNLVSKHINPGRIRHGDKRGHIAIYSEDYDG